MSGRVAALDIGGTRLKLGLFEDGEITAFREAATPANGGAKSVLETAAAQLSRWEPFEALGVSTAGQVEPGTGRIAYANGNLPGYTGMDVGGFFVRRFGIPTAVENDVYAAALGEGAAGAARGETDYLCVTFGTGVGGGVILGGAPYYGAGPSAGVMIGGLVTHPEAFRPGDPFSGTFERFASAAALRDRAARLDPSLRDGREIFRRIGEPAVRAAVDAWLDEVAAGLTALIHVYNIPCVVLGGGVMEQPYAARGAAQRVGERLIPGFRGIRVTAAQLGNKAGLYGAALLARQAMEAGKNGPFANEAHRPEAQKTRKDD